MNRFFSLCRGSIGRWRVLGVVVSLVLLGLPGCQRPENAVQLDYDLGHPLRFSQDGHYLVTAVGSRMFHLAVEGTRLQNASSTGFYRLEIMDVAYSANRSLVAAGGYRTIHIHRGVGPTGGGGMVKTLHPQGMIWCLDFSPDQQYLATSFGIYETRTWQRIKPFAPDRDHATGAIMPNSPKDTLFGTSDLVQFVRFLPDGKQLYLFAHERLLVLGVPQWQVLHDLPLSEMSVTTTPLALAPNGTFALARGRDTQFHLARVQNNKITILRSLRLNHAIKDLAFEPSGKRIAVLTRSALFIWDVASGKQLFTHNVADGVLSQRWLRLAWHPAGTFLALSRIDNKIESVPLPASFHSSRLR